MYVGANAVKIYIVSGWRKKMILWEKESTGVLLHN